MAENKCVTGVITPISWVFGPTYNWFLGPPCRLILNGNVTCRRNAIQIQWLKAQSWREAVKQKRWRLNNNMIKTCNVIMIVKYLYLFVYLSISIFLSIYLSIMNINNDTAIYIYICLHFIQVYIHMFIIMNHESIYQTSLLFSCFVVVHSFSSDPSQLVINERYAGGTYRFCPCNSDRELWARGKKVTRWWDRLFEQFFGGEHISRWVSHERSNQRKQQHHLDSSDTPRNVNIQNLKLFYNTKKIIIFQVVWFDFSN